MLNIRPAVAEDSALILQLVRDLATYEREPDKVHATLDDIRRDGFGPDPKFKCVVASWDGAPAGFALYFYNYSTWQGRPGLYLEDLFVRPAFRKKGIGKALLVYLAQVALRENCGRFQWQVLDWNKPAIDFYQSLGADIMNQWLTVRMEGKELETLAGEV